MLIKRFKIKDICDIKRGRVISKLYIKNNPGEFPVYSSATVNNGEIGKIKDCDFNGEYVTWTTDGAQAGSVFYRNGQFNATNVCGILKVKSDEINPKFLAYALRLETPKFVNYACPIPKLMQGILAEIELDFPPLQIQEKIATILDTFTELSAELSRAKRRAKRAKEAVCLLSRLSAQPRKYPKNLRSKYTFRNFSSKGYLWN